jgi:thiamine biosynthesis lipoprotein
LAGSDTYGPVPFSIDLGGIAKGFACDEALKAIGASGVESALIKAGGDIVVSGPPPGSAAWPISLGGDDGATLALVDQAVSTSGDAEQFLELYGVRYSHIVDPRTGTAVTGGRQVTVVGNRSLWTDTLASAEFVQPGVSAKFRLGVQVFRASCAGF